MEDKVIVNIRDKIKKENEGKQIYLTAEKEKIYQNENFFISTNTYRE